MKRKDVKNVLVVEDELDVQIFLKTVLEDAGFAVDCTARTALMSTGVVWPVRRKSRIRPDSGPVDKPGRRCCRNGRFYICSTSHQTDSRWPHAGRELLYAMR